MLRDDLLDMMISSTPLSKEENFSKFEVFVLRDEPEFHSDKQPSILFTLTVLHLHAKKSRNYYCSGKKYCAQRWKNLEICESSAPDNKRFLV